MRNRVFTFHFVSKVPQSELDLDIVKTILSEYRIHNADVTLRYDMTLVIHTPRPMIWLTLSREIELTPLASTYSTKLARHFTLMIFCKYWFNCFWNFQDSIEELDVIYKISHCVPISAHHKWNFDDLLEKMLQYLKLMRMYISLKL